MEENKNDASGDDRRLILIVDDDEFNRAVLANIFSGDYSIAEAENGREGLEFILENESRISAVLLDVMMPVMNGLELLEILKISGVTERVPVFFITSEPNAELVHTGYDLGVMDVIAKPVVPYVVLRRVNSIVDLFNMRRSLGEMVRKQSEKLVMQANRLVELDKGLVQALATAIEFRDGDSGRHVLRIYEITKLMLHSGLVSGLDDMTIENIALASIMHDIGKISIPDRILNKMGRLDREEYEIMKTHTIKGAELLRKIPVMRKHDYYKYAYDIALHHHERYDGRGYPEGLVGDQNTVWAQIVALADCYDALLSKRAYKDAFSHEKAMSMLENGECGVFNSELLMYFREVEPHIYETIYNSEEL